MNLGAAKSKAHDGDLPYTLVFFPALGESTRANSPRHVGAPEVLVYAGAVQNFH